MLPVLTLLLFAGVFGRTMGAGIGGDGVVALARRRREARRRTAAA
jgi:hypothetical protein